MTTPLPQGGATIVPVVESNRPHECVIEEMTVGDKTYPRTSFAEHVMRWYNKRGFAMFTHVQCKRCGIITAK